ncbi:hypothetical protein P43SY_005285 [Pythium insidiosum]|uniref:Radial spoke protein 3 n=1 Tax=Pythium insidiosum TaxID=114742 RepID=A0AAD5LHB7_PYTIN|nr:hypothetical protein P43SY_005285 [Pythium insidiosum]
MNAGEETQYSYSSKPRAVQTHRAKAARDGGRDDSVQGRTAQGNIMHDPRVVRGSVFAAHALMSPRASSNNQTEKSQRRKNQRHKSKTKSVFDAQKVASYSFTPFSLDANLIEQVASPAERDSFSQTDEFVRFVSPKKKVATADGVFQRPKVGVDTATQIETADNLFDFDREVKPLLNVLVNKTLAQALAEVKEENEMVDVIETRQRLLRKKADAERVDRELEDKAKEAFRQKEAEKQSRELKRQRIRVMKEKVAAWQIAHRIVPLAIAQAEETLTHRGVFYDPLEREVTQWLDQDVFSSADVKLRLQGLASTLLDEVPVGGFLPLLRLEQAA